MDGREQVVAQKLQRVHKDIPPKIIHYAVRHNGTFENAMEWLDKQEFDLHFKSFFISPQNPGDPKPTTAKREVSKPTQSIREKFRTSKSSQSKLPFASEPVVEIEDSDEDDDIIVSSSRRAQKSNGASHFNKTSSPATPATRRRLVKGSRHSSSTIVSEEEMEETPENSEYEVSDDEDEDSLDKVLDFLNNASLEDISDISATDSSVVRFFINSRPFKSLEDARKVTGEVSDDKSNGKKRTSRPKKTIGDKIVDACDTTLRGYEAVDSLIQKCEKLGSQVSKDVSSWGISLLGKKTDDSDNSEEAEEEEDDDDHVRPRARVKTATKSSSTNSKSVDYFPDAPSTLAPEVVLKDYQQVGINWLSLLYKRKLSCILADEMGLGKTCQVISFIAHLKEIGEPGPHLVVVPSSTLENWLREFQKFCPSLVVEPYYGNQSERAEIREALSDEDAEFDVLITTYNLACGSSADFSFLKHQKFNVCVYDEGHMLKNSQSERYSKLMRLRANFRLLLTGTPLQNNLKELVSLLAFILPEIFASRKDDLSVIFKHKAKSTTASAKESSPSVTPGPDEEVSKDPLLSEQRITRAKTMMAPFVLRRKKEQVLHNLPPKLHQVIYCELSDEQQVIYDKEIEASREIMRAKLAGEKNVKETGNILMRLRKASLHHLLFREVYNNNLIRKMSKEIMKEPQYVTANQQYIYEDMEVMTDAELNNLCEQFPTVRRRKLKKEEWMKSGKIQVLQKLLPEMKAKGNRVLIFSQFTQMLNILERVLDILGITYLRMDGQTQVDMRQDMIDKFYNETDITVFLLSTKAGGFGINLTCANTVIIYDLSFNPHDDKQAEDRAHRVGQTRDVNVIRLITKNTIEENILELANTKLALDRSVSGEDDQESNSEKVADQNEKLIASQVLKI